MEISTITKLDTSDDERSIIEKCSRVEEISMPIVENENYIVHENIIQITSSTEKHLIYHYCEWTLEEYIYQLPPESIHERVSLIKQLLNGLAFLHSNGWVHRDLKPSNIFVDRDGILRIGDLDLLDRVENTLYNGASTPIQTLNYSAPEILFEETHYDTAIDLWSLGVVIYEIFTGTALFSAEGQIGQLCQISQLLGAPTNENWPQMQKYESAQLFQFEGVDSLHERIILDTKGMNISAIICQEFENLIRCFLVYDNSRRIQARDALTHSFFSCLDDEKYPRSSQQIHTGVEFCDVVESKMDTTTSNKVEFHTTVVMEGSQEQADNSPISNSKKRKNETNDDHPISKSKRKRDEDETEINDVNPAVTFG